MQGKRRGALFTLKLFAQFSSVPSYDCSSPVCAAGGPFNQEPPYLEVQNIPFPGSLMPLSHLFVCFFFSLPSFFLPLPLLPASGVTLAKADFLPREGHCHLHHLPQRRSLLHLLSAEAAGRRQRPSCAPCAISVAGDLQACHLSLATGTPRPAHSPVLAQGSRATCPGFHLSWHWVCPAWRDFCCWPGPCFAQKSSWWMAQAEGEPKTDMCAGLGPLP